MLAAIIRCLSSRDDRARSTVALPTRAPEAKSVGARRDTIVAYACSTADGSTSVSGTPTSVSCTSPSNTYTPRSSRGSAMSFSSEQDLFSQIHQCTDEEEKAKWRERARRLARELCHGGGDIADLERWLSEMGVGWVLDLAADSPAGTGTSSLLRAQPQRNNLTERWIWALTEITESTLHFVMEPGVLVLDQGVLVEQDVPGPVQLVFKETVLKMLPFVDALLAATDLDASTDTAAVGAQALSEKLQALLGVRDALQSASRGIPSCFDLLSLLSEKEHRLEEAIWNTMEEVRTSILSDGERRVQTPQGSSNICKDTRSLMAYIKSLWNNYWRLNHIVRAAEKFGRYVPNRDTGTIGDGLSAEQDKTSPLITLALEMVSSLEVKLAKRSESFPDHSLRFIFLINNTNFIQQQLHPLFYTKYHTEVLTSKIEGYIQKYLQAAWVPVVSCLYNPTPCWFRKNSALPKFGSEFQKTYTAQKLWKVPEPELRTRLRKAIIKEVIPGLTGYLEGNNITSPGVTPQEREKMLLELFEG